MEKRLLEIRDAPTIGGADVPLDLGALPGRTRAMARNASFVSLHYRILDVNTPAIAELTP